MQGWVEKAYQQDAAEDIKSFFLHINLHNYLLLLNFISIRFAKSAACSTVELKPAHWWKKKFS